MQTDDKGAKRLIWDLPTRVFHWALAGSFLGAYLLAEQDGLRTMHAMFGYTVAGLIVFRLLWGFIGSRHSRFRDFTYSPAAAVGYLRDLVTGRAHDHDGHNPAGSWAIYALLTVAAATAATGWLHYNEIGGDALEELHETLANAWLVLVVVHVAGVIVASLAHHRNLVTTMITGRRAIESDASCGEVDAPTRVGHGRANTRPHWVLGSALTASVLGFWTWSMTTGGGTLLADSEGPAGERQHGEQADHASRAAQSGEHEDDD